MSFYSLDPTSQQETVLLLYAHLALLDSQGQPFVKLGVDPEYVAFGVQVYVCKFPISIEQGGVGGMSMNETPRILGF